MKPKRKQTRSRFGTICFSHLEVNQFGHVRIRDEDFVEVRADDGLNLLPIAEGVTLEGLFLYGLEQDLDGGALLGGDQGRFELLSLPVVIHLR